MSKATLLADLRTILRYFKNLPSNGDNSFKTFAMRQVGFGKGLAPRHRRHLLTPFYG